MKINSKIRCVTTLLGMLICTATWAGGPPSPSLASANTDAKENLAATTGGAPRFLEDHFEQGPSAWAEGTQHGQWILVFNGFGKAGLGEDSDLPKGSTGVLFEKPQTVAEGSSETHASLVTSAESMGDFDLYVKAKTIEQLRKPTPNPWETAWLIWHYKDPKHFYYFALKTNGWELGKRDPAYPSGQRFLKSGALPTVNLGFFDGIHVKQTGATVSVVVNGKSVTEFTDNERLYSSGKLGYYNEDASVEFDDVSVTYRPALAAVAAASPPADSVQGSVMDIVVPAANADTGGPSQTGGNQAPQDEKLDKGALILVPFTLIVLVQMWMTKKDGWTPNAVKIIGITIIGFIGAFAALTISQEKNASGLFGLLGTVVGYLAGKSEDKSTRANGGTGHDKVGQQVKPLS